MAIEALKNQSRGRGAARHVREDFLLTDMGLELFSAHIFECEHNDKARDYDEALNFPAPPSTSGEGRLFRERFRVQRKRMADFLRYCHRHQGFPVRVHSTVSGKVYYYVLVSTAVDDSEDDRINSVERFRKKASREKVRTRDDILHPEAWRWRFEAVRRAERIKPRLQAHLKAMKKKKKKQS